MSTVFFTGHRPSGLAGYRRDGYGQLSAFLTRCLSTFATAGNVDRFISGGAQGTDQLAFWCVQDLKRQGLDIKNELVLPFPGQEERWSEYGVFSKEEYRRMLAAADKVTYTAKAKPGDYRKVAAALMERNSDMMRQSDICVGLWEADDKWKDPATKSGTADALRKAVKAGLEVYIVRYRVENGQVVPLGINKVN